MNLTSRFPYFIDVVITISMIHREVNLLSYVEAKLGQCFNFDVVVPALRRRCEFNSAISTLLQRYQYNIRSYFVSWNYYPPLWQHWSSIVIWRCGISFAKMLYLVIQRCNRTMKLPLFSRLCKAAYLFFFLLDAWSALWVSSFFRIATKLIFLPAFADMFKQVELNLFHS